MTRFAAFPLPGAEFVWPPEDTAADSPVVRPEMFGAVGDGVVDDTTAMQTAWNYSRAEGTPGKTYKVTASLTRTTGDFHYDGNGSTIYMPAASFSNVTTGTDFGTDAVGIYVHGELSGGFAIENVTLTRFVLESEVSDGRALRGIAARNIKNLEISHVEMFGFPVAIGIDLDSIVNGVVHHNWLHDFTDDTDWGVGTPQITGVSVDNNRVNGVESTQLDIRDNIIERLTVGATFVGAHGYQTDGITVASFDTVNVNVIDNHISYVGEGIDFWCSKSNVSRNTVHHFELIGIAGKHGASHNVISANVVSDGAEDAQGILIGPGVAKDADANIVIGNNVTSMDGNGSCLWLYTDSTTFKTKNTYVVGNLFRPVGGNYAITNESTDNGNIFLWNVEFAGGSGTFTDTFSSGSVHIAANSLSLTESAVIPVCGNAAAGATAGWSITGSNTASAKLPAGQTGSTLVIPLSGLHIDDTLLSVAVIGQVESAGNNVTLTLDVFRMNAVAADNTTALLGTDNVGTLTADTLLSAANLAVTGLSRTVASGETLFAVLTGTTAADTDIDVMALVVSFTRPLN